MTQTTFTDNVLVDGSQDIKQLRVQGHTTQLQPIQTWEDSAGGTLAQLTGDGRFIVGDDVTPDSLIEAHRLETSISKPKRGLHSVGRISGTLATLVQWMVGELELRGSNAIDALHTGLRIRAANMNTGTPTANAELRAADVEVINDATAGAAALPKATGLQVAVTNASGKTITDAAALRLKLTNAGTITNPYAIFSEGPGITHLENFVEIKQSAAPSTPATDFIRLYPKSDGKIYAKNWSGTEYDLTSSGIGGAAIADVCNGRLTLTSVGGTPSSPITYDDVTGATSVYFSPFKGNQIALMSGGMWSLLPFAELSIKLTDTQTGTTTNASAIVTGLTNTSQLIVGMEVTGTGIPVGATISSINSTTQVTLSATATASGTPSLTFKVPHNTVLDIFAFNNAGASKLEMVAWNAPAVGSITAITNVASPVVTSVNSLSNDDLVTIINVQGATGANNTWRVASVSGTGFTLKNLDGTAPAAPGVYTSGGTWRRVNQITSRATAFAMQDGVLVKSTDVTRRYLGTIRTTQVSGQTEDSRAKRFLWNYYNRTQRSMRIQPSVASWGYGTAAWRAARNDFNYRFEFVIGYRETLVKAESALFGSSTASVLGAAGFALDAVAQNDADVNIFNQAGGYGADVAVYNGMPDVGYHFLQPVEYATGATLTFYTKINAAYHQGGWVAYLEA